MGFDFSLVDVFTDRPFGGNRLAVFPDATGIADATMQQLAWEFNFSETTFVLPPSDPSCTCRVRIFTPRQELPFAGHPTVGTAAVLASLSDDKQFVFEEGIGPVRVDVDGESMRLYLDSPRYESSAEAPPTAEIARALSLPDDAISDSWYGGIGPVTSATAPECMRGSSPQHSVSTRIPLQGRRVRRWPPASPNDHRSRTAPTVCGSTREWSWGAPTRWRALPARKTAGLPRSSSVASPPSSAMAP